jgi:hypothetical protein
MEDGNNICLNDVYSTVEPGPQRRSYERRYSIRGYTEGLFKSRIYSRRRFIYYHLK